MVDRSAGSESEGLKEERRKDEDGEREERGREESATARPASFTMRHYGVPFGQAVLSG